MGGVEAGEEYLHAAWHIGPEIPQVFSISLSLAIFTIAFMYPKMQGPVETADPLQEKVEKVLAEEQKEYQPAPVPGPRVPKVPSGLERTSVPARTGSGRTDGRQQQGP